MNKGTNMVLNSKAYNYLVDILDFQGEVPFTNALWAAVTAREITEDEFKRLMLAALSQAYGSGYEVCAADRI